MARPAKQGHKGHPICQFSSKAACDRARKEALGRCAAMTEKMTECTNWAIDHFDGKGYCGQHLTSLVLRADQKRRIEAKRAALDARIDLFLEWTIVHPSIHDRKLAA